MPRPASCDDSDADSGAEWSSGSFRAAGADASRAEWQHSPASSAGPAAAAHIDDSADEGSWVESYGEDEVDGSADLPHDWPTAVPARPPYPQRWTELAEARRLHQDGRTRPQRDDLHQDGRQAHRCAR